MSLAEPGMLQVNIMRSVYMLAATGGEVLVIANLMNLCCTRLLTIAGGTPVAMLIIEVEPEDFDFEGNLHNDSLTSMSKPLATLRQMQLAKAL